MNHIFRRTINIVTRLAYALAFGILMALTCVAADVPKSVSHDELAAYKELQQIKLDALKDVHQKDLDTLKGKTDALDKRIDDQYTQAGQGVDRLGVYASILGIVIAVLMTALGLLGYFTAIGKAKTEAQNAAKRWFTENGSNLTNELNLIRNKAQQAHQEIDTHSKDVQTHAELSKQQTAAYTEYLQAAMGRNIQTQTAEQIQATEFIYQRDQELKSTPESSYAYEDWNTRAHAAFTANKFEDAAYFWRQASAIPYAGNLKVAQAIFNKGVAQGRLGQSDEAISTCKKVISQFGDAEEPALRELVAASLVYKGTIQGQLRQIEEAIATYEELLRRFGDVEDPALSKQVANALNGIGFCYLIQAKEKWLDQEVAINLLKESLQRLTQAIARTSEPFGVALGNRAYVFWLLGNPTQAEADFAASLRAPKDGGKRMYENTLKDCDIYPIPQDQGMRELVKRLWSDFQATK